MPSGGQKPLNVWAQVAYYTGLGFILPAGALVGYIIGWLLDRGLHTAPWLSMVGAFVGVAGGLIEILQLLARAEKQQDGRGNDSSRGPGAS
ncbi:MAG TPA: AtpZ/AtpI family protein [Terriglobia bacterium]|nr:AtpZ/AtpI family protein [Terriglobia bacterium]